MKTLSIKNLSEAKKAVRQIGVMPTAVDIMAEKCLSKVIEIKNVSPAMANILKQEMLAVSGDAAIHSQCSTCKIEKSTVLLIGTIRQFRHLIPKLKSQVNVGKLPEYAEQLSKLLFKK